MIKFFFHIIIVSFLLSELVFPSSRIKDIVNVESMRSNMLVGYGLVVGLNGTGDNLNSSPFTKESLVSMLERLGVNTRGDVSMETKNVAAVMVTAVLPPFARQGTTIDVTISALGNSKSLLGGTLLVTPLLGADGEVYAVSQGSVATSGFSAIGKSASVTKGVPTSGRILSGAIIEKEIGFELEKEKVLRLSLVNPDFTTAKRISDIVNQFTKSQAAKPIDPGTISVRIPDSYNSNIFGFVTDIEQLRVMPDIQAKVVIDDKNGVVVIGENVRISSVAITHGALTIKITEDQKVSQPQLTAVAGPGGTASAQGGQTIVTPQTNINVVDEGKGKKMVIMSQGASLADVVNGINALGVSPRDLISILESIKAAGALQSEIEVL